MTEPHRSALGSLMVIAIVIGAAAAAFAYTAGWFSPQRLTPTALVDSLAPAAGPSLGHRRNHAKGVCFTGEFDANGAGSELSTAQVFARGQYPVLVNVIGDSETRATLYAMARKALTQPRCGRSLFGFSQGSGYAATLGYGTKSLRDK